MGHIRYSIELSRHHPDHPSSLLIININVIYITGMILNLDVTTIIAIIVQMTKTKLLKRPSMCYICEKDMMTQGYQI